MLKIFQNNRELFKDRKVYISLWRDESSPEADAVFEKLKKENKPLKGKKLGFYENWRDLPSDSYLIDLCYERNSAKPNSFQGIYRIPDHPLEYKFRKKNGKTGIITICIETDCIDIAGLRLRLDKHEEKVVKAKIKSLWESRQSKGDNFGKIISFYDAWPILFK